jgi:hypothetical protein
MQPPPTVSNASKRIRGPALGSLVVEQATGLPAPAFDAVSRDEVPREQERVWAFDWYGIFPPTLEELAETERATKVCREAEYVSNFTSRILEGKNTLLSIEEQSNK